MTKFPSDTQTTQSSTTISNTTEVPKPTVLNRAARRALLGELPQAMRELHVEVLQRTLAEGVPVRPAALIAVLSAHDDLADEALLFSTDHVNELLWCGVADFCDDYGIAMPDGCREALYAVLALGSALDLLNPKSDDEAQLFTAFRELVAS